MDPELPGRPQEDVLEKVKALALGGANLRAHAKVEGGYGKTSLVSIVASEQQDWLLKCLLDLGAQPDHTIVHALEKQVARPLGDSLVKGRENRSLMLVTGQGIISIGKKSQKMFVDLAAAGFSPLTNWNYMRRALSRPVPDHTSFKHPERPLGEIVQERFPVFHAALESMGLEREMAASISQASGDSAPPRRPGSRF